MKQDISNNTFLDHGVLFNDFLIIYKRFFGRLGKSFSFGNSLSRSKMMI